MNRTRSRALLAVSLLMLDPLALAQAEPSVPGGFPAQVDQLAPSGGRDALHFDRPGDGALWARSPRYKARFDRECVRFVPYLGPSAPRSYPVDFALRSVTHGDLTIDFDADCEPRRDGEIVSYERGSVTEFYVMSTGSMEQCFRFDRPHWDSQSPDDDLVVSLEVATDLQRREPTEAGPAAGFEWGCAAGSVRYGRAVVFDARGAEVEAPTSRRANGIEIRVPGGFLAQASFPLTIDPVISSFSIHAENTIDLFPDVTFVAGVDRYAVVWQSFFSATDWDIWCETYTLAGSPVEGTWIDMTQVSKEAPRIASNRLASRLMVTAQAGLAPHRYISSRWRDAASTAMGSVRNISSGLESTNPDIGGDHKAFGSTFCIAFEQTNLSSIPSRVVVVVTDLDGAPFSGFIEIDAGDNDAIRPAVSNSCGPGPTADQAWTVAYEVVQSDSNHDIYVRQIRPSGAIGFGGNVATSGHDDRYPAVSSPLDGDTGERLSLVTWVRDNGRDDVMGRVLQGVSWASTEKNLSALLAPGSLMYDQQVPSVDSDGSTFFVTWSGERPDGSFDVGVGAVTYADGELRRAESMNSWASDATSELLPRICSRRSGGGPSGTGAMGIWIDQVGLLGGDIEGGLYESPGAGDVFCTSHTHSGGQRARLSAKGSVSLAAENLTLRVTEGPPDKPGLFFLGTAPVNLPFGDGHRCVGGLTFRVQPFARTDAQGCVERPLNFNAVYGSGLYSGSPGVFFQYWFRDPQGGPAGFNLSDGLRVELTP